MSRIACLVLTTSSMSPICEANDFQRLFTDPVDGAFDASNWLTENAYGFLPVPILITEPALGTGGGLVGLFFHENEEDRDKRMDAARQAENASAYLLPPSVTAVAAAGTSNGSWFGGFGHMGFWKQGRVRYVGYGGYGSVNLDYYGTESLPLNRGLELNTDGYTINQTLKFQLGESRFFAGVKQNYISADVSPSNFGEFIGDIYPPGLPPGVEEGLRELLTIETSNSGAGFVVEYDSRNNIFTPQQGYNYTAEYLAYRDELGGDFNYEQFTFEGLNYWPVGDEFVAALRLGAEVLFDDEFLPPYAYPSINVRGIPAARYQGDRVAVAEFEGTWKLTSRWSLLGFVGGGRAADEKGSLDDATTRVGRGVGFRYQVARRYGFFMGVDYAEGPEESAVYIQGGSAW